MSGMSYRVSADIGGTFTDLVFQDAETGALQACKILSTPAIRRCAVIEGLERRLPAGGRGLVLRPRHDRRAELGARPAGRQGRAATTQNYRDVYTIQGNDRREIFSIHWRKPKPLVAIPETLHRRRSASAPTAKSRRRSKSPTRLR